MGTYRKKPAEVEAIQFDGTNVQEIWDKFGAAGIYGPTETNPDHLILTTTHGDPAPARVGDWVVPDSRPGTFYPIKPDVFEATYEPMEGAAVTKTPTPRPPQLVCICGSTRFREELREATIQETLAGRIVLAIGLDLRDEDTRWADEASCERLKVEMDRLHLEKIRIADEVLVLNPGGYIGWSTRNEIAYAEKLGKPVRYLEAASGEAATDG